MPTFMGVRWIGPRGHQMSVVVISTFASCGRYVFRNFIYDTKIIISEYVVQNCAIKNEMIGKVSDH